MGCPDKNIIVLTGPTAAGKTDLAIHLALRLSGEIISADSRQIYQKLECGTGKPSPQQLQQIKHHLISSVDPNVTITAENYSSLAIQALAQIKQKGKQCLVVGGTGLWLRSFLDGLSALPSGNRLLRQQLTQTAETEGNLALYRQLEMQDPEISHKIHPNDRLRIVRALEIISLTGKKVSSLIKEPGTKTVLPTLWFGLTRPKEDLYLLAEKKIEAWLEQGWLEEVKNLLAQGVPAQAPAMQAIGYSHLIRHLQGEYSLQEAIRQTKRDTRRFIKRQMTWFRANPRIKWLDGSQSQEKLMDFIIESVQSE